MRNCLLVLGMILVAGFAFAAPIDGKWVGEIQGQDGSPMQISYTFKADGATLTGTTKAPGPDGKDTAHQGRKNRRQQYFIFSLVRYGRTGNEDGI